MFEYPFPPDHFVRAGKNPAAFAVTRFQISQNYWQIHILAGWHCVC